MQLNKEPTEEEKIEQLSRIKIHVQNQMIDLINEAKEIKKSLERFFPKKEELTMELFKVNTMLNMWQLGKAAHERAMVKMGKGESPTPLDVIAELVNESVEAHKHKTHKPGEPNA